MGVVRLRWTAKDEILKWVATLKEETKCQSLDKNTGQSDCLLVQVYIIDFEIIKNRGSIISYQIS